MLFHLEPDKSLTGGAWYNDQDFEAEFVVVLSQQCFRYLQQKQIKANESTRGPREGRNLSFASSKDVWEFISELGISKVRFFQLEKKKLCRSNLRLNFMQNNFVL